ncbi:Na+/H+ antiporter NhaA [Actinotalea sp. M2MS4P-6]|uniref:Na+/H+ antiporter NhaA n=1 Tax=Actinotalea sp. M2MS4P-6 TaxID=2983762 RepID=UPI0021E4A881|nr:Na+/H+ antiporter NhaA [Actinotalea sp. M2MS4P-6]MCV2395475.1 Na+/H+ antiporter NhaA [Actinotalea sp. M2MS4P-6]
MSRALTRAISGQTAPRQLLGQFSVPLRRFMRTEAGSASILLAVTALALLWANSPWSAGYRGLWETELSVALGDMGISMSLGHWINDAMMAVFFFVVGLEVRRDLSVGELTERRRLVLPVLAGVGGLVLPAVLYLAVNSSGDAARGWGVVIGSDTAFLLGALALVGPSSATQLRVFLLTLMVFDDIVAVTVIGVAYSHGMQVWALVLAVVGLAALVLLGRFGVWRTWPYVLVALLIWWATLESGVHTSIAGMAAGLCIPSYRPRRPEVEGAARWFTAFRQSPMPEVGRSAQEAVARAVPVNERLQVVLLPWAVYVVVPVFALANAGVDLRGGLLADALRSPITWGVVLGLVIGKFVGIGAVALGGARAGLGRLPQGVGPGQVLGGAALSGIGFTVSLLIVGLAFESATLRDEATVGVLLALVLATGLGWLVFRLAAVLHGERTASLPTVLDRPVDPTGDHVMGPADAPLTLVEYGDFECPFCARATGVAAQVREHFGPDLRYVFRHLPLPDVHPSAELAAAAAEAAGAQGAFWAMHDLLFAHQDELERDCLAGYAADLGLDVTRFLQDLDDPQLVERIRADVASAEASGARGTPTFFVGSTRHIGPYDAETLIAELEESRAAAEPSGVTGSAPAGS